MLVCLDGLEPARESRIAMDVPRKIPAFRLMWTPSDAVSRPSPRRSTDERNAQVPLQG